MPRLLRHEAPQPFVAFPAQRPKGGTSIGYGNGVSVHAMLYHIAYRDYCPVCIADEYGIKLVWTGIPFCLRRSASEPKPFNRPVGFLFDLVFKHVENPRLYRRCAETDDIDIFFNA